MMEETEPDYRFKEFMEHIILRTFTDNYSRNHFPILLESSNSYFWSHDIFDQLNLGYHHYPALDTY